MGVKVKMSVTECKVAIIGAGNMAKEHARAFNDVPGVRLVGIHSRTRSKAKALAEEFHIEQVFDSISELYDQTHANLVVVTVFEMAMNPVSRACFEYPWTVLLEKPPGYTIADAREIRDAAKSKKRYVLVALNRRFLSSTQAAIKDLSTNPHSRYIHVIDQEDLQMMKSLGHPDIVLQNWMYANSIHVIDYLRFFGRGSIESIQPILSWDSKNPGIVLTKISFSSGDIGIYEGIWCGPGPWSVSITTSSRRWEMRPLEQAAYQNSGERNMNPVEAHKWDELFKPGLRYQAEEAVKGAMGLPSQCATIDEAYETMCLVEGIFS